MNPRVFEEIRGIVYRHSGIRLRNGKETMVSARLAQRLRVLNLDDDDAYLQYLKADMDREIVELLNVISTNVTRFFRESEHFAYLRRLVSEWSEEGQRSFRIWCAASSTGEEPYTLAMTLRDVFDAGRLPVEARILATDISTRVLDQAQRGIFEATKLEPVPEALKRRYFNQTDGAGSATYEAKRCLKEMLLFKRLNLSTPPFPMRGSMDVIFCRNVMIYFDDLVRDALVEEFHRLLRPGGYLIVGMSESLVRSALSFERAAPSIYRRAC